MIFKFYTSVERALKLKVREFGGLCPTFVEVTGETLVGGPFTPHPFLKRVNDSIFDVQMFSIKSSFGSFFLP